MDVINRGYYIAARGYEFYLRVLQVSLTSEQSELNVNVVEKNYIKAQKYLTMKRKLAFYWLIVLFTMTTPISSHVKDKNDMFTARGEDMIF